MYLAINDNAFQDKSSLEQFSLYANLIRLITGFDGSSFNYLATLV